jgi:cation transport ATPase
MANYRKASKINLVVGMALIFLSIVGLVSLYSSHSSGADLFWAMGFVLIFSLVGGYETGKYIEMRLEQKSERGISEFTYSALSKLERL